MEGRATDLLLSGQGGHFKAVFEHSLDAIGIYRDWPPTHQMVNPAYARLFGFESPDDLQGMPSLDLIAPSERERITDTITARLAGRPVPSVYETLGLRKDGSEFDMEVNASTYVSEGQTFRLVILRDVTARKNLEAERRNASQLLEKRVAERTSELSVTNLRLSSEIQKRERILAAFCELTEREQNRIGVDLHDGLGQELTGIRFLLAALQKEMESDRPDVATQLKALIDHLMHVDTQMRGIARGLFPMTIHQEGLEAALGSLVDHLMNLYKVECRFSYAVSRAVTPASGMQIYRVVQEAFHNAVKHGHASRVTVKLAAGNDDSFCLSIRDNGCGFDSKQTESPSGMGLNTIGYRVRSLDGDYSIEPHSGGGVLVKCTIPGSRVYE